MSPTPDDYRRALQDAFHDLRRRDRDENVARAMEGVEELDAQGLARLGRPADWAREYRAASGIRPRRTRGLLVTVAALGAIALAISTFRYVDGYEPGLSTPFEGPGNARELAGSGAFGGARAVWLQEGAYVERGVVVSNSGHLPVDVLGIDEGGDDALHLAGATRGFGVPDAPAAFPVHVPAGGVAMLDLRLRMEIRNRCAYSAGVSLGYDGVRLRIRVARLFEKVVLAPFSEPLDIAIPNDFTRGCPPPSH